jgi:hypothetical protein
MNSGRLEATPQQPSAAAPSRNEVRDVALKENTANSVFQILERVEGLTERSADRWVWELIQNALDARSEEHQVSIRLSRKGRKVVFEHHGKPFSEKEVAHLIYHGSSKVGEGLIGQYGTGFLTTHVLSRRVTVSGPLESGGRFSFTIDRNGEDPAALLRAMDQAWEGYLESIINDQRADGATVFEYELSDSGEVAFTQGIAGLREALPFVLAFNPALERIALDGDSAEIDGHESTWTRGHTEGIPNLPDGKIIRLLSNIGEISVAVLSRAGVQVAALLGTNGGSSGYVVRNRGGCPSLFTAFPLRGTSWFWIPCVVNSLAFRATEDRLGVVLGKADRPINSENKSVIIAGLEATTDLIAALSSLNCTHLFELSRVSLPDTQPPDWLEDIDWLRKHLVQTIDRIRELPLLETASGKLAPSQAKIPIPDEGVGVEAFHDLTQRLFRENAPRSSEITTQWIGIVREWASVMGHTLSQFPELATESSISSFVGDLGSLEALGRALPGGDSDAILWVNEFVRLTNGKQELSSRILPSQAGRFGSPPEFWADAGVADDLRTLGDYLGLGTSQSLLDKRILGPEWLGRKGSSDIAGQVLSRLKELAGEPSIDRDRMAEGSARFIRWTLTEQEWSFYESRIPVLTRSKKDQIAYLGGGEKLLRPYESWTGPSAAFHDLFPSALTMSSRYGKFLSKPEQDVLVQKGFVFAGPFIQSTLRLDSNDLALLAAEKLEGAAETHRAESSVLFSDIAFLTLPKDRCVVDSIRSSEKAGQMAKFMLEAAPIDDPLWSGVTEVACSCQKAHKISQTYWVRKVRERMWVPVVREGKVGQDYPTTENFRSLAIKESIDFQILLSESGVELLRRLGVEPLAFLSRTAEEQRQLVSIARQMRADPDFRATVDKLMRERDSIRSNQRIGHMVQALIDALLRNLLGPAASVVPNYDKPGFDEYLEARLDPDTDAGQVVVAGHFLEIKATQKDYAAMTTTQAGFSIEKGEAYSLCVVSLSAGMDPSLLDADQLQQLIRIVPNIAAEVRESLDIVRSIPSSQGGSPVWVEHTEKLRFAVSRATWEQKGISVAQFLRERFATG